MQAFVFRPEDADAWDAFCDKSYMSTFMHRRRFLSYHGQRFDDASLVFEEDGKWLGLLPAARDPNDPRTVISHPGITYGGIVHAGELRGEKMLEAMRLARSVYTNAGYQRFCYKVVPSVYHQSPAQDDLYALFREDARRYRCDLSCAIDLDAPLPLSQRRRRGLRRALSAEVDVHEGIEVRPALWAVLVDNLERKHQATPVHTIDEISLLHERFPDNICFVAGLVDGSVEGGVVLFDTPTVSHAQYIASSLKGYDCGLLDMVFEFCIERARRMKMRYFDFGISNEQQGRVLNEGLYRFKSEFGGGGIVHEFYEILL